jgi:hypothetical protein
MITGIITRPKEMEKGFCELILIPIQIPVSNFEELKDYHE